MSEDVQSEAGEGVEEMSDSLEEESEEEFALGSSEITEPEEGKDTNLELQ